MLPPAEYNENLLGKIFAFCQITLGLVLKLFVTGKLYDLYNLRAP